jgi:hypothetical protein
MSDELKKTSIAVDPDTAEEADQIALVLGALAGVKVSRSSAARRAIHDLYIRLCLPSQESKVEDKRVAA